MIMNYLTRALFLAAACSRAASQELSALLSEPTILWEFQLQADVNLGPTEVLLGNGVFMAPDGVTAFVTTLGATVYAFNAYTGEQKWVYQPAAVGTSITRSHSGVTVAPSGDYMVYSVVDDENSLAPAT
jgi:outer membrane protein assembly factor BamB